jgi:hypothetical protein
VERARASAVHPGRAPGRFPEDLEVVIEVEGFAAPVHATQMRRNNGAVNGRGDCFGTQLDVDALADVAHWHQ